MGQTLPLSLISFPTQLKDWAVFKLRFWAIRQTGPSLRFFAHTSYGPCSKKQGGIKCLFIPSSLSVTLLLFMGLVFVFGFPICNPLCRKPPHSRDLIFPKHRLTSILQLTSGAFHTLRTCLVVSQKRRSNNERVD